MSIRQLEQSHIDLSRIPPLEANRLIGFVNNFAISLVQQLNNLVQVADSRLQQIHSKIVICKTNLVILEKKLASVPGLEASVPPPMPVNLPSNPVSDTVEVRDQEEESTSSNDNVPSSSVAALSDNNTTSETPEEGGQEMSSDANPDLVKYYRMLKVGVPLPAVKIKMQSEGFDPNLLKP